jgi:hypothetical protein
MGLLRAVGLRIDQDRTDHQDPEHGVVAPQAGPLAGLLAAARLLTAAAERLTAAEPAEILPHEPITLGP